MSYTKTVWVDQSSPDIDAANLNNIEDGVSKAAYSPDASANQIPVGNGSAWVYQLLKDAQVDPAAAIAYSKLALAGSIVNADVATGAAIAYAKLNIAGMVADADIASGANLHKLSAVTGTPTGAKFLRDDGTWNLPPGMTTYRKTTAKIVNNTVTETDLLNGEITIAANPGTTAVIRLTADGDWLQNSGAATAGLQFRLKLGGTTLLDTGVIDTGGTDFANSASRKGWTLHAEIRNLGAANSQWVRLSLEQAAVLTSSGVLVRSGAFTTGEGSWTYPSATGTVHGIVRAVGANASAIDTTSAQVLALTVIHPAASVNLETKLVGALVEVV